MFILCSWQRTLCHAIQKQWRKELAECYFAKGIIKTSWRVNKLFVASDRRSTVEIKLIADIFCKCYFFICKKRRWLHNAVSGSVQLASPLWILTKVSVNCHGVWPHLHQDSCYWLPARLTFTVNHLCVTLIEIAADIGCSLLHYCH